MTSFATCCAGFRTLTLAAAKAAAARFRGIGAGRVHLEWARRAAVCESCPLRVVRRGVSYCGKPLLEQVERDPTEGCGCPTRAKAQSPTEHCPLDVRHRPISVDFARRASACACKWCELR